MGLITNKDNIYVIVPYGDNANPITSFMEKSFSIFVRAKIISEELPFNDDCFIISKNGKHAGITVRKFDDDELNFGFAYWFKDNDNNDIYKNIVFSLPSELKTEYNDYVMRCDHIKREFSCYFNKKLVGIISYDGLLKENYTNSFIWFGCGSMTGDINTQGVGSFIFEESFAISESVDLEILYKMKDNHKTHITHLSNGLPVLNNEMEFKDKMLFYLDFKNKSNYKLWNLVFNGIYPQFYIKNNIYY